MGLGAHFFIGKMILYKDPFGIVPIIEPVVVGMGYNFWGIECQTGVNSAKVCVYIDHNNGISLDDCSRVSEQLSAVLDVEDPIRVPYNLEISSPGINRPLFNNEHLKSSVGRKVKIKTLWPINERRNFSGMLLEIGDQDIKIKVADGEVYDIAINAIKSAKLNEDITFNGKDLK